MKCNTGLKWVSNIEKKDLKQVIMRMILGGCSFDISAKFFSAQVLHHESLRASSE